MKCANCGDEIPEGMAFCCTCGTPVPTTKKCIKCGQELQLKMMFCGFCGTRQDGGQNPAAGGGSASAVSMGDKNVVSGDIIGNKEETHIAGNATIIKNEDETKKMVVCHVCGKNLPLSLVFTCSKCGQHTCESCFDSNKNCCKSCVADSEAEKENVYKQTLTRVLEDGIIEVSERRELMELQKQLGLSDTRAHELEEIIRANMENEKNADDLTTFERIQFQNAYKSYYDKGDYQEAFNQIEPVYKIHPANEAVISIYVKSLYKIDSAAAVKFITSQNADMVDFYIIEIENAISTKDFNTAEMKLKRALAIWGNNKILQCLNAEFFLSISASMDDQSFCQKAEQVMTGVFDQSEDDKETRTYIFIAREKLKRAKNPDDDAIISEEQCAQYDVYYRMVMEAGLSLIKELDLTPSDDYVKKLSNALPSLADGAVIRFAPGEYVFGEFEINGNVHLCGEAGKSKILREKGKRIAITLSGEKPTVRDLTFETQDKIDDNDVEHCALYILKSEGTVENCVFTGHDLGLMLETDVTGTVKNCKFQFNGEAIGLFSASSATLENLTFENTLCGLSLVGNETVLNCSVRATTYGILVGDGNSCHVRGLEVSGTDTAAVCVNGGSPEFEQITVHDVTGHALEVEQNGGGTFTGFTISNVDGDAIRIADETSPVLKNFKVDNVSNGNGLLVTDKATGKYTDFDLSRCNDKPAVNVNESAAPDMEKITVHDQKSNSFCIRENAKGSYKDIDIHDCTDTNPGFVVRDKAAPEISNVKVRNIESYAFWYRNEAAGKCTDVSVSNSQSFGFRFDDDSCPFVARLKIAGTKKSAVCSQDNAHPAVNEVEVNGSEAEGLYILDGAKGEYTSFTIKNALTGVILKGKSKPVLERFNVSSCKEEGFYVWQCANGVFNDCKSSGNGKNDVLNVEYATVKKCSFQQSGAPADTKYIDGRLCRVNGTGAFTIKNPCSWKWNSDDKYYEVKAARIQNDSNYHSGALFLEIYKCKNQYVPGGKLEGTEVARGYVGNLNANCGWSDKVVKCYRTVNNPETGDYYTVLRLSEMKEKDGQTQVTVYSSTIVTFNGTTHWNH